MGSLDGPFVALLEQDGAYQACDGGFVREDAVDLGAALDLAVQALQRVGGVQLGSVLNREGHVGQHVGPRPVHQGGELRQLGAELVGGTPTPCQRRTKNALLGRSKNASLVIERGPPRGPSLDCGLSDLGCVL